MKPADAQLVERALAGDDAAFDELVSRYRGRVYNLALSMVRSRETALDLAQDVFVRAYMSLPALREPERFRAWLTGIASNTCKMYLRKPREVAVPSETMERLSGSTEPTAGTDAGLAREIIDRLPNGARSAAVLYFVEGMKQAEIAEFLGISVSAVKARIRDARARLQKEMIHMTRRTVKREEPGDEFNRNLKHRLELARYYREFSELINSGTSLMRALHILREGDYPDPIKQATSEVMDAVMSGSTFSAAIEQQPALLTPEAVSLLYAGEVGGTVDVSIRALANCIDAQNVVNDVEACYWCRTLAELFSSGVGLLAALECGAQIAGNPLLKRITGEMAEAWAARKSAKAVLQGYAGQIPPVVIVAIAAGEGAETLDFALAWAAEELAVNVAQRLAPSGTVSGKHPTPDDAFLAAVASLLSDDSAGIRAAAAHALGRLGARKAGADVAERLADDDPYVRKAAVRAVVALEYRTASEALAACVSDTDKSVRYAAIRAIQSLQLRDAVPALVAAVADPDPVASSLAADALASFCDPAILAQHARDLLPHIHGFGCVVSHSTPQVTSALMKIQQPALEILDQGGTLSAMKEDPELRLAWLAALALAQMGRGEGIPVLLAALDLDDEDMVRKTAFALGRLDRREAVPRLIEQLYYPHHCAIQRDAAQILAGLGDPSPAQHIRNSIEKGLLGQEFLLLAERLENQQK